MTGYKIPPSVEKSRRIREAFEMKVTLLERWALNGLPETIQCRAKSDGTFTGEDFPRDNSKLMRWRGPDGNLPIWNDPLISRPVTGKHPDLAERFQLAVEGIDAWIIRKRGRVSALEHQVAVLETSVRRLTVQNAALISEVQQLREDLALAKAMPTEGRR
jgi:hypothetical protein